MVRTIGGVVLTKEGPTIQTTITDIIPKVVMGIGITRITPTKIQAPPVVVMATDTILRITTAPHLPRITRPTKTQAFLVVVIALQIVILPRPPTIIKMVGTAITRAMVPKVPTMSKVMQGIHRVPTMPRILAAATMTSLE